MPKYRSTSIAQLLCVIALAGCSGSTSNNQNGAGGVNGVADSPDTGGSNNPGGQINSGGSIATAGTATASLAGASSTGGSNFAGGSSSTGGTRPTSSAASTGGSKPTGGAISTSGAVSNGGMSGTGGSTSQPGSTSRGPIPASLPGHMLVGVFASDDTETWIKQSGVKWDVRWTYLAGQHGADWYNSWGYGAADGSWIGDWFTQCDQQGFIPGVHLYNIGYGHDGGDSGLLTEVRTASFVSNYFTEFKVMMQKAKAFGKPVIIVLEGDSFGMIEGLTGNDPNAAATIASSGLTDLAGLPNTVAGLGLAYLQIRKSVGAYNVALGPDVPAYEANGDILYGDNSALQPHVDFQTKFFLPFGLGTNATGDTFDFTASNPLSGDADFYRLANGDSGRWWDASDSASINSQSFNRYAEWLRLFNQTTGRRWILHQIPIGNSNMLNVDSNCQSPTDTCTPRTGYKDNRPEYFFNYDSPSSKTIRNQHLTKFADAGVFALLFGAGDGGSTTPYNDTWTDGQLYLKSRVSQLITDTNGGFAIQ